MLGESCGVVGMGLREWQYNIVLATIQTLTKNKNEFKDQLSKFNVVIFDETQIIAADSYVILSKMLINTKWRFAFSATARRDDGNDNIIFAHSGTVVFRKPALELIAENVLVKPIAFFHKAIKNTKISDNWQSEYYDGIVINEGRNNQIKEIVESYVKEGKSIMILTTRIEHGKILQELIENSRFIYGKTDDDIRESDLEDFKNGVYQVLVGNIMIFNKGINIKRLTVLINASGNAGSVVTVQTIGRELRKCEGKTEAFYIDFIDSGEYLNSHSHSRIEALRNEGYEIKLL
jgi:superfamily II DNA or RNA helicase